jgi:hypothetical protein
MFVICHPNKIQMPGSDAFLNITIKLKAEENVCRVVLLPFFFFPPLYRPWRPLGL